MKDGRTVHPDDPSSPMPRSRPSPSALHDPRDVPSTDVAVARRLSIPLSLAVLVGACLLPALLALAAMIYVDYRAQEAAVLNEAVIRARTMRFLIDGDLEAAESGLQVLATSSFLAHGDLGRFQDGLRDAMRTQAVHNYVLLDPDGRQRVNTLLPFGSALPTTDDPDRFRSVFEHGKPFLSGVFAAPFDGSPIVALGVPVFRGEQVVHALVVTLEPGQVIRSIEHDLPRGWIAAVIDPSGHIVARLPDQGHYVGSLATPSVLAGIAGRAEGITDAITKDGVPVLTAFSRSPKRDWTVAIGAPKSLLVAPLHRSIAWLVVATLVALGLVLWFALGVSRVVTRSVASLIEPALALGNGQPIDLPSTPFRETDAVAQAIREASRKLAAAQHHAYHDPLTDLRNRTLFDEMAGRQIAQAYRDGAQLAILAIDLDGFKAVNDRHGHAAGDRVLMLVASRITGSIRGSDVVSRRGGDEFSVLLVDVDGVRTRQVAEKLLAVLSQPYPGVEPSVSASIGVARYPHDATTLPALLERADEALYAAKNAGKRRVAGDF